MADKAGGSARASSRFGLILALLAALAGATARAEELTRAPSQCDVPADQLAAPAPLPHVTAALKDAKKLNILTIGSPVGIGRSLRKSYPAVLENLLERALAGIDVVIVNRPVSGEIASTAVERIRTEVALSRPDLLVWQVGANDALARVSPGEFEEALTEGVRWAKSAGVDILLVGFEANPWLHDDKEAQAVREATSRVAHAENVLYLRRFDAMKFVARTRSRVEHGDEPFSPDTGYECMAEQVAQALASNLVLRRARPTQATP
jgi:acyl-CoA thioesterase-1